MSRHSRLVLAVVSSSALVLAGAGATPSLGQAAFTPGATRPSSPLLAVRALGRQPGVTAMTTGGKIVPSASFRMSWGTFAISPDGQQVAYESDAFAVRIRPIHGKHATATIRRANDPAWSADGTKLAVDGYGPGAPHYISNIFTVVPGHPKRLFIHDSHWDTDPTWSPDGTQIAFERETPSGGVGDGRTTGIYISDGKTMRQLVSDRHGVAFEPVWSPDGRQIAFTDTRHGKRVDYHRTEDVYVINVDGTHLRQLTHDPTRDDVSPQWSPDGHEIAFSVSTPGNERAAVGVRQMGVGGPTCLLRPSWSDNWPIHWLPGQGATPAPRNCKNTLRPPRPKPRFGCTTAAARTAVDRSDIPLSIKQYAHPGPWGIIKRCLDFTRDGRQDLAVLFNGGGSAGVLAWAAFRRTRHDWKKVLLRYGDRLSVSRSGSDLVETHPVYRNGDCHCNPTGGVAHRKYGWNGHKLVVVARWHTKTGF